MKKILFISALIVTAPLIVSANGGVFIWPPNININQTDQNAIIAWNGQEETLILSTNWEKTSTNQTATLLKVVPLPSEPSDVKEGDSEVFQKLADILNEKINAMRTQNSAKGAGLSAPAESSGVKIVLQKIIGAHDVTIVKVSKEQDFLIWVDNFAIEKNLEKKQVSDEFKAGLLSYLKRNINYFVFDVVNLSDSKNTIKPLVYKFKTSYFYFPLLVSGTSEIKNSQTMINLFLIFSENLKLPRQTWPGIYAYPVSDSGLDIKLSNNELKNVSQDLSNMFSGNSLVRRLEMSGRLGEIDKDLMLFPQMLSINLRVGMRNNDVKILQQLLINEGFWSSDAGVTGYFGPATKEAVMKLQNQYKDQILKPLGLSAPTGLFGPYTRKYFNENIFIGMK